MSALTLFIYTGCSSLGPFPRICDTNIGRKTGVNKNVNKNFKNMHFCAQK